MKIIIVGAGPSGLLLALLLAKEGFEVQVLEASDKLDNQPRACHYASVAAVELDRAGVLDEIQEAGFFPSGVCWRTKEGTVIGGIRNTNGVPEDYRYRMVCLPLGQVIQIMHRHLKQYPTVEIKMEHRVVGVGQDDTNAWVYGVENPSSESFKLEADYVVGCDGANSQVRRALFGDWNFPGWSWDKQIVATNVYYPFEKFAYWDSNFIIHPDDWYMAAKITNDGMWRVTYGDIPGLTDEEYIKRQPMRFEQMLPGSPKPGDYKLVNIGPYKMHQRLAPKLRVGRILLAADAAHLCNPFGGMGLTGGIADVGGLYDCFVGIHAGKADDSILDKYDEMRRERYHTVTDPISAQNFRRLWDQDPNTASEKDPFFAVTRQAEADMEFAKKLQNSIMDIGHSFTQYYAAAAA